MCIVLTLFYQTSATSVQSVKQSSSGMLFPLVAPQEASGGARYGSSLFICKLFCSNFLQMDGLRGQ